MIDNMRDGKAGLVFFSSFSQLRELLSDDPESHKELLEVIST